MVYSSKESTMDKNKLIDQLLVDNITYNRMISNAEYSLRVSSLEAKLDKLFDELEGYKWEEIASCFKIGSKNVLVDVIANIKKTGNVNSGEICSRIYKIYSIANLMQALKQSVDDTIYYDEFEI